MAVWMCICNKGPVICLCSTLMLLSHAITKTFRTAIHKPLDCWNVLGRSYMKNS